MRKIEGSLDKKEEDYFKTSMLLLNEPGRLLDLLLNYDKEHIN